MKQKVSTILCIVLLALQLNSLVTAEERRTVSGGDIESAILNGDIVIAEGTLEQAPSVSSGDPEEAEAAEDGSDVGTPTEDPAGADPADAEVDMTAPDVSGGDVIVPDVPGGDAAVPDVSGGDAEAPDVSGGDAEVPGGTDEDVFPDVSGGDAIASDGTESDAADPGSAEGDEAAAEEPETGEDVSSVSDGDAWKPSVSAGDVSGGDVSGGNAAEELLKPIDLNKLAVVRMQVPRSLDFVIDPCEICGQGTVWSRDYAFCNNGEAPVKVKLSNIKCSVREDVVCVGSQVSDQAVLAAANKTIKLQLRMSNGDVVDITQAGAGYETTVNPGEAFSLSVAGAANIPTGDWWKNGDVSIAMVYRAEICED